MLSLLPLYYLQSDNSVVLIDEPERSLFPDIQMELMDHYERLCPNSQIIVATHSPFIAASFEPEEGFIFRFDEKGKVAVSNGIAPKGDDPNDILRKDFGMKSLMNETGLKQYEEYMSKLEELMVTEDPKEKVRFIKEAAIIGDKYNFGVHEAVPKG